MVFSTKENSVIMAISPAARTVLFRLGTVALAILEVPRSAGNRPFAEMEFWIWAKNATIRINLVVVLTVKSMQGTSAIHLRVPLRSVGSAAMVLWSQERSATTRIKLAVQSAAK
jgi:hypothetical protein